MAWRCARAPCLGCTRLLRQRCGASGAWKTPSYRTMCRHNGWYLHGLCVIAADWPTGVGLKQGQKGSLYIRAQHCSVLVYLFCLSLWDVHDLYSVCARRVTYSVSRGNFLDWSQLGVLVLTYLIPGHDHLECSPRRDCSRYTRSQSPALRRVVPIHCQSLKETSLWSILPLEESLSAVTFPRGSLHPTDAQLSRHTYTHKKKNTPFFTRGSLSQDVPPTFYHIVKRKHSSIGSCNDTLLGLVDKLNEPQVPATLTLCLTNK